MSILIAIRKDEFKKLADYIKANFGIRLKEEKEALVTGRLQSVLTEHGFTSFSEYYDYVLGDKTGEAAAVLVNRITTNHTFFMREPDHFDFFKDTVLPYLKENSSDRDLRIWSAGCSSGEEPYTLAMLIDEFFGKDKPRWDTKILATDISTKVLTKAQQGIYSNQGISSLSPRWKQSYFKKRDAENSVITDAIKNEVIFRQLNLTSRPFPFKRKFDVIFCRNVMIYFDNDTKTELVNQFYELTKSGGYLFVGHAESLNRDTTQYQFVKPAVYRKL